MFEKNIKQKPIAGFGGFGGGGLGLGGGVSLGPFVASGGTKTGPEGGYYYHRFDTFTPNPERVFTVTDGISDIEIAIQGGGGTGGAGSGYNGGNGGGGGGGGATGVWTIAGVTINTYPITVAPEQPHPGNGGSGNTGGYSQISHPSAGYARAGGGAGGESGNSGDPGQGGAGGTNTDPWAAATITQDYTGTNGTSTPYSQGAAGGPSGGHPQPVSNPQPDALWWRVRITNPGYPHLNPAVYPDIATYGGKGGNTAGRGQYYGGGGGGGNSASQNNNRQGGAYGGMVILRYPDAV